MDNEKKENFLIRGGKNFFRNLPLLFSAVAVMGLLFQTSKLFLACEGIALAAVAVIAFFSSNLYRRIKMQQRGTIIFSLALAVLAALVAAILFYQRFSVSSIAENIASRFSLSGRMFVLLVSVGGGCLSLYFLFVLFLWCSLRFLHFFHRYCIAEKQACLLNLKANIPLLVSALFFLLLNSAVSLSYADWQIPFVAILVAIPFLLFFATQFSHVLKKVLSAGIFINIYALLSAIGTCWYL